MAERVRFTEDGRSSTGTVVPVPPGYYRGGRGPQPVGVVFVRWDHEPDDSLGSPWDRNDLEAIDARA